MYAVDLPLDISGKESLSNILPYITWGLIWDSKTKEIKESKHWKAVKVFKKPGKIEISQIVIYWGMRKL